MTMGIVTTEQAVRAKARSIADRYFKTGHVSPSEDKAELIKLIEDAFLVDPPGAVPLGREVTCEMVRVVSDEEGMGSELPPCGKPRRRAVVCDACFERLITSGEFTREEADRDYPLLSTGR